MSDSDISTSQADNVDSSQQSPASAQQSASPPAPPQQFAASSAPSANDATLQAAILAAQHVLNQQQNAPGTNHPVRQPRSLHNTKPPPPVQLEPPEVAPDNWKLWKELYANYSIVSHLDDESQRFKRSFLISTMGKEALQLYNRCSPLQTDTANDIIAKLDSLILGTLNETFERYKFNTRSQKPGESIDIYVGDLKILAQTCGFCNCGTKDSLIRDRIILGVSDIELRKILLHERNLTLEKCIDIAKAHESTTTQLKALSKDDTQGIHKLSISKHHRKAPKDAHKPRTNSQMLKCCLFCAQQHVRKKEMCPAWGKTCTKCKRKNHFSQCCSNYKKFSKRSRVHQLDEDSPSDQYDECDYEDSDESDIACLTDICAIDQVTGPLYAEMFVKNTKRSVTFQIDCGATVNVIHKGLIGDVKLKPTKTVLRMYNKTLIYPLGKCKITLNNPSTSQQYCQTFQVVEQELVPILSRASAENMSLITVNYLARFLKDLSTVFEPIRRLTKKDEEWKWAEEQDEAFEKIKNMVSTAPILKYYDAAKELIIQCDASSTGLGATLLQDDHPLAYVSRALTPTERNYSQMEKECLAIVFSTERFHQYTFGRQTTVHSDHKPLQAIMRKPLSKAPKRLQAMMLRLMHYDLEVVYKKGTDLHIADMLSRAHAQPDPDLKTCFGNINAISHLRVSKKTATALKEATSQDEVMKLLKEVIIHGWPEKKDDVPVQIAPYFSYRDELTVHNGLIMKGERIVIPKAERRRIKESIHASHLGQGSALRRARECVYWPGMTDEIRQMIETCETCNTYQAVQQKQTLQTTLPEAEYPWQKVGVDLFSIKGKDFLVTVCYTSGFWEIDKMNSTRSSAVIDKLKCHFARFGIPDQLVSDNGPQFACDEFAKFTESWDIEHFTSSPGHARANGKAEAAVKQAKHMIMKCEKSGSDPMLALLEIRNTPQQDANSSPAQRLLNRRTRTLIPTTSELLKPRGEEIMKKDRQIIDKATRLRERHYNKTAKDLKPLEEGDVIRMKPFQLGDKEWKKAIVIKRLDDRSYDIETKQGVLRRNREDLRKTKEQIDDESVSRKPMIIASHREKNTAASTTTSATTKATESIENPPTVPNTPNQPAVLQWKPPLADQNPPSKPALKPPISPSVVLNSPVVRRSSRITKGQLPSRYKNYEMIRK